MEMPEEMRKALYGASSTNEKRDPFMEAITAVPNPWVAPREGEVRIPYEGDDDEERKFSEVHEPLERIFRGIPDTAPSEPATGRFRFSKQEPTPPADQPLEKRAIAAWSREFLERVNADETLTIKYRKNSDGDIWREGYNAAGEIKEATLVHAPDEEVLAQLEK